MTDTLSGRTIGKYQLLEKLGRGGMAEVYKGYQESLDRYVAIKLMHAFLVTEQDFLLRFKREAKAMASLRHPNIVAIYDFDVYRDDIYYLVMEYVSGGTLKQKLENLGAAGEALPLEQAVQIALQVAEALDYAHGRGMVHRDVKPANIMLNEDGRAILTDFGIVKLVGGQTMAYTATGALIGTPSYMSPEQALGKPGDERVDIYALGVLLFQMTTGQLPYSADTPLAVIMQHVNTPIPEPARFNPNVPPALQDIILRAMAKEPDDRYQTARDMAADLRALQLAPDAKTAVFTPPPPPPAPSMAPMGVPVMARVMAEENTVKRAVDPAGDTATAVLPTPPKTQPTPLPAEAMPPAAAPTRSRSGWTYAVIGLVLLGLIGGGFMALNGRNRGQEPTPAAIVADAATDTPASTKAAAETPASTPTNERPTEEPETAVPVEVASPTTTPTIPPTQKATAVPTVDATAQYLAACKPDVTLVNTFTYQNEAYRSAPVRSTFPVSWVLQNSGDCPWKNGLGWTYRSGDEFGFDGNPLVLDAPVQPGETVTLTARLTAPANPGSYTSAWSLIDLVDEAPFGPELSFNLQVYVPATATAVPTNTPAATPTISATATVEQATTLIWVLQGCEYIGPEWRCQMQITPYGGGGGPYTVWVFDADQPAEYRGTGPFYHFAKARRCSPYIHEVRVQDDATGTAQSQQVYIDPEAEFPGGCTLP